MGLEGSVAATENPLEIQTLERVVIWGAFFMMSSRDV